MYLFIKSQPAFASISTFQRPFLVASPTPSNPKPTSPRNLLSKIPCGGFSRKGESGKRFWQRMTVRRRRAMILHRLCLLQVRVSWYSRRTRPSIRTVGTSLLLLEAFTINLLLRDHPRLLRISYAYASVLGTFFVLVYLLLFLFWLWHEGDWRSLFEWCWRSPICQDGQFVSWKGRINFSGKCDRFGKKLFGKDPIRFIE